jgi:spermidine/putrescine transport system substrate-binding protein
MRKLILLVCIVLLAFPVYAQDAAATETEPWTCPDGFQGQTLNVFNWTTYIAEDTVGNFQDACGVSVVYDTYESNEALLARLRGGNPGYDIIVPTDHMVATMISLGLLEPLDMASIPNFANVSPDLTNPSYDPENEYSVPYQWGTIGVGYDTNKVEMEITSWDQVFNYDGPVAWLDDPRAMIGIALQILGYDPNTSDPNQVSEARDFLINNGGNVVAIAGDDGQAMLERGDVDITVEYMGDIFQVVADCECDNIAFALPVEGGNIWVDNLAIPTGAPNKPLAEAFINYILDPQVGADISNYTAYASPNQAAIDAGLIDPEYLDSPIIYPPEDSREHLFYILPLPDAEQYYNDAWDEIKISLGR